MHIQLHHKNDSVFIGEMIYFLTRDLQIQKIKTFKDSLSTTLGSKRVQRI